MIAIKLYIHKLSLVKDQFNTYNNILPKIKFEVMNGNMHLFWKK